jgi:hypothetical protein
MKERLRAGVWNAAVLFRELRECNYDCGLTILDQKLRTSPRMHEAAFYEWGAGPDEILYDQIKTVWTGVDERGEIVWNAISLDFARYWGFTPRLCRPYRAQTKGRVEAGVKYVRHNFLCGLQEPEPANHGDFNVQLRWWIAEVANQRVHGATHEQVMARWEADRRTMCPANGRMAYPHVDDEQRTVARDAHFSWKGSRGIRCPGIMPVKLSRSTITAPLSRSATTLKAWPCTRRRPGAIRSLRSSNTIATNRRLAGRA